ncbi:MAG: DUF7700 domain-containing protein [Candidatus Binatia bacterium]
MPNQIQPLIVKAGGVRIEIEYRHRGSDAGLTFQVYDDKDEMASEVLRFDCFKKRPHFHYINSRSRKIERIDKKTAPNPVLWALTRIKTDLQSLVWRAGHRNFSQQINQPAVASALAKKEKEIIRLAQG